MSQRKYNFVEGEFYHIYNRGTDKRTIFQDLDDYQRFQMLLYVANDTKSINVRDLMRAEINPYERTRMSPLVAIGAYCLMPNHYHVLITPLQEGGASLFFQKLSTSYSMYFNKKYERTGTLFEGKFKSQLADDDRYLKYIFSYIHLNPVKLLQPDWKEVGIKDKDRAAQYLKKYTFSSYKEAIGEVRRESSIVESKLFPNYFENFEHAEREIQEWLSFSPSLGKTWGRVALGLA